MGLWSKIKAGLRMAGRAIKNFFSNAIAKIGGIVTTAAAAVATFAANPVVKTVATVVSVAVPVLTVGAGVVKAIKAKKETEPETVIEKMLVTDDEAEIYHDEGVDEMRQVRRQLRRWLSREQRISPMLSRIRNLQEQLPSVSPWTTWIR